MRSLRRVGLATGTLTDDEINHIETEIVTTVRPMLVGRQLMPIKTVPHAGLRKYTYYRESDMGQATIDMYGETESQDIVDLEEDSEKIPIIHKEYTLHWREVLARRNNGQDLNAQHAQNAARQVAEEEDRLILSGETITGVTPWPAMGIQGFTTVTNRNAQNGGDWSTTYLTEVSTAKQTLRALGYYGPYKLVLTSTFYGQLEVLIANTEKWAFQAVGELIGGVENILVSDNIFAADGAVDSVFLADVQPGNFELVVGADLTNHLAQKPNMNYFGRVWEAVVPIFKRPEAIVEINTLT